MKTNNKYYLGIDTSNYTTSVAIIDQNFNLIQYRQLLPVKKGEKGIRQSDAVFHHTKQIPVLLESLFDEVGNVDISSIGVSVKPTSVEGSYMPCFLVGETVARSIGTTANIPVYNTTHQVGHVLAGIVSSKQYDMLNSPFIAFHVSGGTTDCLLCTPNSEHVLDIKLVASSLDLKGGQLVDRVGVSLGLDFPCGKQLESLAMLSDKSFKVKATLKNGNCCLSGIENLCNKMLLSGENHSDIAMFCLEHIYKAIHGMTKHAIRLYGSMPILYVGGVMSNSIIKSKLSKDFRCSFATTEYSCDNALGVAYYGKLLYDDIH